MGPRVDNLYVIESGLQPGDQVVIEGGQKLQNNMPVSVTLQPAAGESTAAAE